VPWLPRPAADATVRLNARFRAAGVACAALLILSVAVAFAKGRPWDFPPARARTREIPGTQWTIQVPENLAARSDTPGEVTYGLLMEDALIVAITTAPGEAPREAETFLRGRVQEHLEQLGLEASARVDSVDAVVIASARTKTKSGAEYAVWVFWTDDRVVDVEALLASGAPSSWQKVYETLGPRAPPR
jgi:hypothetical protein